MSTKNVWDKYEIALLIDTCEKVLNGTIPRKAAIKQLSTTLRERAVSRGKNIDGVFRNENGIALQMSCMMFLLTDGKNGLEKKNTSFEKLIEIKKTNFDEYERILLDAKQQISSCCLNSTPIIKKTVDKSFLTAGLTIPKSDVETLCQAIGISLSKGESCTITIVIDGNQYFAKFTNIEFSKKYSDTVMYQIRYSAGSELGKKVNEVFSYSAYQLKQGRNIDKKEYVEIHANSDGQLEFICHPIDRIETESEDRIVKDAKNCFAKWLSGQPKFIGSTNYLISNMEEASNYAVRHGIAKLSFWDMEAEEYLFTIKKLLKMKLFRATHRKVALFLDKYYQYYADYKENISEINGDTCSPVSQKTSNPITVQQSKSNSLETEAEVKKEILRHKLYSVSRVYNDPQGLSLDHMLSLIGSAYSKKEISEFLDEVSWATKLSEEVYTFSNNDKPVAMPAEVQMEADAEPTDFDKKAFIRTLMSRFQNGMQFDSIDLEIFCDTYEAMFDERLPFTDEELEARLKYCGILYKDHLFPEEGIIDSGTKERLFTYIENKFTAGNKVLYYKAIFHDLADAFAYCFSLTDEQMLKAYIEYTAEKGKYYFHSNFMSIEKNVKIDHSSEIEDFMLAAGKPLSYDEVYVGLSHISKDIIYREIRNGSKFLMNEKEHYYHIDIFECSESDSEKIAEILNKEIEENGYAIWTKVFDSVKEQMPVFLENNLYLSPLGIRNALSRFMADRFDFDGEVISTYGSGLGMADVFRLYAKHNTPFSDTDLYNFSKTTDTTIYFWALAEESVRVSKSLFVAKDQIDFDIEATDKALETYLSSGYILVKDVDSFLLFPNVGYEWNEFLLESYLLHYSKKFCLVNNGTSLNNVAGAVAKKDGSFTQFVDICAQALADSGIELKKAAALNYLAEINLITRRSYKELDIAMAKARQIRNRKG